MQLTRLQKLALTVAGLTAFVIGGFILTAPYAFYASYGITLPRDPNLLSELRAPGAGLAGFGLVMLTGAVRAGLSKAGMIAALTIYIAFPAGRLLSALQDGIPSPGILAALAIEIVIAGLLIAAFAPRRSNAHDAWQA